MNNPLFEVLGGVVPQFPDEVVVKSGPANHWRGIESVGGLLTMTNARLHFRPHAITFQRGDFSCALLDIVRVEASASLWIIPNQIVVVLRDGRREKFVVQGRDEWVARLSAFKTPYR
jgi:hypothetical protein